MLICLAISSIVIGMLDGSDQVPDGLTELRFVFNQLFKHFEVHLDGFIVNSHVNVLVPPLGCHAC